MTVKCEFCEETFNSENYLKTHMLLKHREEIVNSDEYNWSVSNGGLNSEVRAEKGEQFGYKK